MVQLGTHQGHTQVRECRCPTSGLTSSTCMRPKTMIPASPRCLTGARLWWRRAWRPALRLRRTP
eukprot:2737196-Pleurochrysis_carterae.AAC.1